MTTTASSSPTPIAHTLRRRRGLTEEAAAAAVDQACRRLRLPTIRARVDEAVTAATKEQLTYPGFLAELLLAECDDRDRRRSLAGSTPPGSPATKRLERVRLRRQPHHQPRHHHTSSPPATGSAPGEPLCLIGDSGTGKSHLLIALGHRRRRGTATGSATPWPPSWSTSSSKPPTTAS